MNLDEIAKVTQPGTSTDELGYTTVYEALLRDRRDAVWNMLEIGVLKGASLKMWRDYFPLAQINGIDIHSYEPGTFGERISVFHADQSDPKRLHEVMREIGNLDFVSDDGSHKTEDQITALSTLFPYLNPGAVYVIEDIRTTGDISQFLKNYQHFFCVPNDMQPEKHDGTILAVILK